MRRITLRKRRLIAALYFVAKEDVMQFVSYANRPITPSTIGNGLFLFDSGTNYTTVKSISDWSKYAFNCLGMAMTVTGTRVTSGPVRSSSVPVVLHKIPLFSMTSTDPDLWLRWTLFDDVYAFGKGSNVSTTASIIGGQVRYFLVPPIGSGRLQTGNFTTYKYEAGGSIAGCNTFYGTNVNAKAALSGVSYHSSSEYGNYRSITDNFYFNCSNAWGVAAIGNFKFGSAAVTSVSEVSGPVNTVTMTGVSSTGGSTCNWMGAVRKKHHRIDGTSDEYEMIVLKRNEDYADDTGTSAGASKFIDLDLSGVLGSKFFLDAPVVRM